MTSFNRPAWMDPTPADEDHAALLAWDAELEAARAPIPACSCYDPRTGEYDPATYPCDYCRSRDLTAIDLDGYDDKREPGAA